MRRRSRMNASRKRKVSRKIIKRRRSFGKKAKTNKTIDVSKDFPEIKGKVFFRISKDSVEKDSVPDEYERHAYQYATSSHFPKFIRPAAIVYVYNDDDIKKVIDYAKRKNMKFEEAEKWLGPALGY